MAKNGYNHTMKVFLTLLSVLGGAGLAQQPQAVSTKTLRSMARTYMSFAKYDKAHVLAQKALQQAQSEQTEVGELALCLIDYGTVCSQEGLLGEAREKLEQGVRLQKQALFADHPYVAHTLRMLSDVHRRQGNLAKAETVLTEAFEIMLRNCDLQSKEMAPFIAEAATLQFAKGDTDKAKSNYVLALDLYEQNYGVNHVATAALQESYAKLLMASHEYEQADELLAKSLAVKTRIFGRYHLALVDNWLTKAALCKVQGKADQCEYYLARSTAIAAESRNVVTIAEIYDKVNRIRSQGLVASAL